MSISINTKGVLKNLAKAQAEIPFATSRAMQITIMKAVTAAERSAELQLDRPTPIITKAGFNKGVIRGVWPSKQDVKRNFRRQNGASAEAKVFIVGRGARRTSGLDLINELHPLVYGGIVTNVPDSSNSIITPTKALIRGLSGRGRLKKLNRFGNLAGFKAGILKKLKANDKLYLNVPLNNTDKKTKHLPPGLYFKGRELSGSRRSSGSTGKALTRSNARTGRRATGRRAKIRTFLVMLLAYDRVRVYKKQWNYPQTVRLNYQKHYNAEFFFHLQRGIRQATLRG